MKKKILGFEKEEETWKSKEESLLKNIERKELDKNGASHQYEAAIEEKNKKIEDLLAEIKKLEKNIKIMNEETSCNDFCYTLFLLKFYKSSKILLSGVKKNCWINAMLQIK